MATMRLGFGIGIAVSIFQNYNEISDCIFNCSSWALKVEKLLSYIIFIYGATTPGQWIYELIRYYVNEVLNRFFGVTLDSIQGLEQSIETLFAYIGFGKLTDIWSFVRNNSLCMLMNNCTDDFFNNLIDTKIALCGEETGNEEGDWDSRQLSICEQIMNDSPLIIMSICMLALYIISNFNPSGGDGPYFNNWRKSTGANDQQANKTDESKNNRTQNDPNGQNQNPDSSKTNPNQGSDQQNPKETPAQPPEDTNKPKNDDSGSGTKNDPQQDPSKATEKSKKSTTVTTGSDPSSSKSAEGTASGSGSNGGQIVKAKCPKCSKEHEINLPRPAPVYCQKKCCENHQKSTSSNVTPDPATPTNSCQHCGHDHPD